MYIIMIVVGNFSEAYSSIKLNLGVVFWLFILSFKYTYLHQLHYRDTNFFYLSFHFMIHKYFLLMNRLKKSLEHTSE